MKCKNCGSENIEIISEYVETNEKYGEVFFGCGFIINFIILVIGISIKNINLNISKSSEIISALENIVLYITSYSVGVNLIFISIKFIFILLVAHAFAPHKHITRTVAVCKTCGERKIISSTGNEVVDFLSK